MAAVTATVVGLEIERGADNQITGSTTGALKHGVLYITNTSGSQVAGGTDTLNVVAATAIQGELRNGKTVTLRGFGSIAYRNALTRSSSNVYTEVGATITNSSGTLQLSPVTIAAYSANATLAATDYFEGAYGVSVCWTEA